MSIVDGFLCAAFLLLCAASAVRGSLYSTVVALGLAPVVLAFGGLYQSYYSSIFSTWYLVAVLALLLGCILAQRKTVPTPRTRDPEAARDSVILSHRQVAAIMTVAVAGTLVHLSIVGLPVLSGNVEITRFADGSAYFGLPSRLAMIGLPVATGLAFVHAKGSGLAPHQYTPAKLGAGLMLIVGTLSGFKSGLAAAILTLLILGGVAGYGLTRRLVLYCAAGALLSIGLAVTVGSTYSTYQAAGVSNSIKARLLEGTVEAPVSVMLGRDSRRYGASTLSNDADYFLARYAGRGDLAQVFSYQERVSSAITGTPLSRGNFLVPVTTTAIGDLYYDLGKFAGVIGCFVLGFAFGRTAGGVGRVHGPVMVFRMTSALALYNFIIKGGLLYSLINYGFVLLLFSFVLAWFYRADRAGHFALARERTL